jgi:superfamily II DNA/RNA helicase
MTATGFEGIELTERVAAALAADGITQATPVQRGAIGAILEGRHVLMHASTGSGKTLAYLLPILQRLRAADGRRAVVFAPGTELAMQTARVAEAYQAEEVTVGTAVATTSHARQRDRVQRSTRLVVGTPDRLLELFAGGKLKQVHTMVFDELEPILSSAGASFLYELLSRSEPKVQIIVASATLGPKSDAFIARFMADCVRVDTPTNALTHDISHHALRVPTGRSRDVVLARFLQEQRCRAAIVFVNDPNQQSHLYHFLAEHGHAPVTVTHERGKQARAQGLEAFRSGAARVMLVSDSTARGLDVPGVAWVFHYDLPRSAAAYVHRAGRTGRAGQKGSSVVLVEDAARGALRRLAKELGLSFAPA